MKRNRLIALIVTIVMLIASLPAITFATDELPEGVIAQGDCGTDESDVKWFIDTNGTLTIYGNGAMKDYEYWYGDNYSPWHEYRDKFQKVVVQYGVTNIGQCAFLMNEELTSIKMPGSITKIGWKSFEGCTGLTSIDLPRSVRTIEAYAFRDCDNLISINIPNGITDIETMTFHSCDNLKSVTLPDTLTKIDSQAFLSCISLNDINIPNSVQVIGESAFGGCTSLKSFVFPTSALGIGDRVLVDCTNLESVTIPKSITRISSHAFDGCTSLKDVFFGGSEDEWSQIYGYTSFQLSFPDVVIHYGSESGGSDDPDVHDDSGAYSTGFTIGRDNNDFAHTSMLWKYPKAGFYKADNYKLDPEYYKDLKDRISKEDQLKIYKEMYEPEERWGGSCYGIAATMALVYNQIVDINDISGNNNGTYHSADSPRFDNKIRNNINYCYLAQSASGAGSRAEAGKAMFIHPDLFSKDLKALFIDTAYAIIQEDNTPEAFLRALVDEAKQAVEDQKVLMLSYNDHCILITGYEYSELDDLHIVYLYDENCGGLDEVTEEGSKQDAKETKFVIEGDYSEGYFYTPFNELHILSNYAIGGPYKYTHHAAVNFIQIVDPSKIGYYKKGKVRSLKAAGAKSSAVIQFPEGSSFRIRNAENKELIVNPLSERAENPTMDGNMVISDFSTMIKGNRCYFSLTVEPSDYFSVDEMGGIASYDEIHSSSEYNVNPDPLKVNGTDEKAALDISVQNNGQYMSLTTTDVEGATFNSDGTIIVEPSQDQQGSESSYSFEAYIPAETDEVAGITVSATADKQTAVSASEGVVSIESESENLVVNEAACLSNGELKELDTSVADNGISIDANAAIDQLNGGEGGTDPVDPCTGGHSWSDTYSIDVPATCEAEGTQSIHCTVCDAIDEKTVTTVPRLGHDWNTKHTVDKEPTCTEDGVESIHCTRCDAIMEDSEKSIPATGHSFSAWETTKKATELATGQKSRQCSVCEKTETRTIAQLKPTLPAVKITTPKATKKAATIKWKKVSAKNQKKIAKIEIQYSLDKNFKKNVKTVYAKKSAASKKITKLKSKKTYYVRVRAYKKSGGVVHISKWSTRKSVKVK